jgi:CO dehydrogenase maturation factor
MAFTIAVAGKGGVGKTTIAGLITRLLAEGNGPVLAIDADPNTNFHTALGLNVEMTIGELREDTIKKVKDLPAGISKDQYLQYGLEQCLVESQGLDLLAMGRGEGPYCYCAVNHVLRRYMDVLSNNYKYVIMDNEAGLEHLSRRTTQNVDLLLVISDAYPVALQAAGRINKLADELKLQIKRRYLIVNHLNNGTLSGPGQEALQQRIACTGLTLIGEILRDENILRLSLEGRSVGDLPASSPARQAVKEILEKLVGADPRVGPEPLQGVAVTKGGA